MTPSPHGKTVIWRETDRSKVRVVELEGFPWGLARLGEHRLLGDYGWGRCSGVQTSTTRFGEQVDIVSFTLP